MHQALRTVANKDPSQRVFCHDLLNKQIFVSQALVEESFSLARLNPLAFDHAQAKLRLNEEPVHRLNYGGNNEKRQIALRCCCCECFNSNK